MLLWVVLCVCHGLCLCALRVCVSAAAKMIHHASRRDPQCSSQLDRVGGGAGDVGERWRERERAGGGVMEEGNILSKGFTCYTFMSPL